MFRDGLLHLLKIDTETLAFHDEFLELLSKKICSFGFGGRSEFGHYGDGPRANFNEPYVSEAGDYFMRGVRIDFEFLAENPDGGKFVSSP